jgi:hypothetical protein
MLKFGGSPCLLSGRKVYFGSLAPPKRGTRGGAEKPDYEKKVSKQGCLKGKRFRTFWFPKESSPLKRSHFFDFFKKSGPRANEPWGHPPQICREKKPNASHKKVKRKDG